MLKIRDDVDLKELEKFGFVPRYSTDTGELVEYFCVRYLPNSTLTRCMGNCGIVLRKKELKTLKIFRLLHVNPKICWVIDNNNMFERFDTDMLFDLQQAGLVEKV